jgi:hypothetical protein
MPVTIICEGKKVKLKHLRKGFIFNMVDNQEWIGKYEVMEEIDESGTLLVRSVFPGLGERRQLIKLTEETL